MSNLRKGFMLILSAGLILIITCYLIYITLNTPYIGLIIEKNEAGEWQISELDHLGWANHQGLKVGDIVKLVNQTQPGDYSTVKQYGSIEQAKTILIDRNGEEILYAITDYLTPALIMYHVLIPAFVFIIILILSFFLYFKKSDDTSALVLILFFLTVGFCYLSAGGSSRVDIPSIYINRIALSLIPALFLEFLNVYFMRYGVGLYNRKILNSFYLINGLLLATYTFFLFFGLRSSIVKYSFLAVFSISILVCLYILISCYIRFRKTIHEPFFKILILGLTLAFFPFVVLVGFPRFLFGFELIPGTLAAVFLVFLPVVFIYLIAANSLFDIDFILSRIRYYSILAVSPTVLFLLFLIYLIGREFTLVQRIQVSFVTYTGIISFLYMKEELDFRFRSKLFKEKFNFQASLDRFSHDLAKVMTVAEFERRLVTEVKEVLAVKSTAIFEVSRNDCFLRVIKGNADVPIERIIERIKNGDQVKSVGELKDTGHGICLIVGEKMGKSYFLWVGEKSNRTNFNQDEKIWLKTIAQYSGLVYENLYLIEGLMEKLEEAIHQQISAPHWVLRLLFNLSEKERRRLASDLHDSALQDQLLWYRKLETISADKRIPEDLRKRLNHVTEGLLDVIHQIRETCNELRPPLLKEMGLVEALDHLFAAVQLRADYVIHFNATGFYIELDYEHVLALYRIVQELLTNATKHSKATHIDITLESSNGTLSLNYRDNGIGMDLEDLQLSFTHLGLSGIKERVSSLEGKTCFKSSLGEGFEVSIRIPVNKIAIVTANMKYVREGGQE